MYYVEFLIIALHVVIIYYLLQPILLKIISGFGHPQERVPVDKDKDFAVVLPVYKDASLIPYLIDSLLQQSYDKFQIYVVADDCPLNTPRFQHPKVSWIIPSSPLKSKIKSIDFAIENFERDHNVLVIFDNDNVVDKNFLYCMNDSFIRGYKVVQGLVKAKNQDNNIARLDEAGFQFYHAIDRKYRNRLGLSSHINGLGIGIDMNLYREISYQTHVGGFDKKLQAEMIMRESIDFREDAVVYDEKVSDEKQLKSQRTRWTFTYFHYFGISMKVLMKGIRKLDMDRVLFGINLLRLPLFLLISLAIVIGVVDLAMGNYYYAISILTSSLVFAYSFFAIVWDSSDGKQGMQTMKAVPTFVKNQFLGLLQMNKARKSFLVTSHHAKSKIEDIVQKA